MTSAIKTLIIKRQKALHEYGKSSESYKFWRNSVHDSMCYGWFVEKLKASNPSKWWKEIKSLGSLSSKSCWYNQLLSNHIPCCRDLADVFNNFLYGLHHILFHCHVKTISSMWMFRMIPNKILKEFANELAPVITDIYNASLKQGVVPTKLKRSIVVPIPKISLPQTVEDDLRPIFLTSQVSKVMEGFTPNKLFSQIKYKLDTKQFGLPSKSTTHALVYLLHSILPALENGNCSVRLFFADFKKGFDLVDHNVIIRELESLEVHPVIVRWIKRSSATESSVSGLKTRIQHGKRQMEVSYKGQD